MIGSSSRRRIGGVLPLSVVLVVAGLTLTGCFGHNGRAQVGAGSGSIDHSRVMSSPSVASDAPLTSAPRWSSGSETIAPTDTQPPPVPGTIGTVSPPTTTKPVPTTAPRTTTTSTTTPPPPGTPVISALSPGAGGPGQAVTLSGSGLFSSNGTITVLFGGVAAGVSCQTQTSCVATVPVLPTPGPARTTVTITTDTGTSRPVPFTYL